MASQKFTQTQQSADSLPGTWKLTPGRAVTLEPREPGVLRVAHGQVWATLDGPHRGSLNDMGDLFIGAGEQVKLRAGQRMVIESWNARAASYFTWDPSPVFAEQQAARLARVVQPLADLRMALALATRAAGRLLVALGGVAWDVLALHRNDGRAPA
jgi:hypothetical protein